MKNTQASATAAIRVLSVLLIFTALLGFAACGKEVLPPLWESATYTDDTTLGKGGKTVIVNVTAADRSISLTIRTDAATLGEALRENSLVEGEESEFGLYIKVVNGIRADFDTDGAYWMFNRVNADGTTEMMMSGVDTTPLTDGDMYELVYTK